MENLKLTNTDLTVSRICAGCMGLGGGWDPSTRIDVSMEKQAASLIDRAIDWVSISLTTQYLCARQG